MTTVDLRSDTVTRPCDGMRRAMAAAEVGDDVFGEDPTVRALEERAAAFLGKEVALFVPSGTMANQIALKVHCQPGDDVIAGSRALVDRAHRFREMLGGGMRQAGVVAAAAPWALDNNVDRLAEDHANARLLAERLAEIPGLHVDPARVQTNIVLADLATWLPDAVEAARALAAAGVLCLPIAPRRLRLVTHLDVDRPACERAADVIRATLGR